MPRTARVAPGNWIFHVLNRANGGAALFEAATCYRDFLRVVDESARFLQMRILAYCLMPNHWHMLLWPRDDGDLARFLHRTEMRHTQRWHARHQSTGRGHIYQGRYKSFAVHHDRHLVTVCRYIERNPVRANLVARAESWPWSSAAAHLRGGESAASVPTRESPDESVALTALPVELPSRWGELLNVAQPNVETEAIRSCVQRGYPYGDARWRRAAATHLGLPLEVRGRGRPRKTD